MLTLTTRSGIRPRTSTTVPHRQLDQQPADARYLDRVLGTAQQWPGVRQQPSGVSVEGARALVLGDDVAAGPDEAFIIGREFCHGHAQGDFSLHVALPPELGEKAARFGWCEPHFLAGKGGVPATVVMLYAPRDDAERDVALALLGASYRFALIAPQSSAGSGIPASDQQTRGDRQ